jgi:hypothetical protein
LGWRSRFWRALSYRMVVRVRVTGGDLDIPEVDAGVEHGRDRGVAEHMGCALAIRMPALPASWCKAAGGRVPVHPGAAAVEQDRPAHAGSGRPVDGPADRWRQRDQDDLGALAAHTEDPVAVLLAGSAMSAPVASKIRRPSRPSMAISAKSYGSGDSRAAVSSASNCRWVNPRWVIRQGRWGRRTCSAGECSRISSRTQVR